MRMTTEVVKVLEVTESEIRLLQDMFKSALSGANMPVNISYGRKGHMKVVLVNEPVEVMEVEAPDIHQRSPRLR